MSGLTKSELWSLHKTLQVENGELKAENNRLRVQCKELKEHRDYWHELYIEKFILSRPNENVERG